MPRFKRNEQTIKDAINGLVNRYGLRDQLDEARLRSKWNSMMGPSIAKSTRSFYVKDGTLYLWLNSAPLKQELHYAEQKLIQKLNKEIGHDFIKEIVIR